MLVNVPRLVTAYYADQSDASGKPSRGGPAGSRGTASTPGLGLKQFLF